MKVSMVSDLEYWDEWIGSIGEHVEMSCSLELFSQPPPLSAVSTVAAPRIWGSDIPSPRNALEPAHVGPVACAQLSHHCL